MCTLNPPPTPLPYHDDGVQVRAAAHLQVVLNAVERQQPPPPTPPPPDEDVQIYKVPNVYWCRFAGSFERWQPPPPTPPPPRVPGVCRCRFAGSFER